MSSSPPSMCEVPQAHSAPASEVGAIGNAVSFPSKPLVPAEKADEKKDDETLADAVPSLVLLSSGDSAAESVGSHEPDGDGGSSEEENPVAADDSLNIEKRTDADGVSCPACAVGQAKDANDHVVRDETKIGDDVEKAKDAAPKSVSAVDSACDEETIMLNIACEALEEARKANLEVEFAEVRGTVDFTRCTKCLRASLLGDVDGKGARKSPTKPKRMGSKLFPKNRASKCLICGCPVCPRHSCRDFRKAKIVVCNSCAPLFSLDYLVDKCCVAEDVAAEAGVSQGECGSKGDSEDDIENQCKTVQKEEGGRGLGSCDGSAVQTAIGKDVEEGEEETLAIQPGEEDSKVSPAEVEALRREHVSRVLDAYDHALLLLRYSYQFIPEISTALRKTAKRNNWIGLGSSATNLVSGITGVAAAVTIFTPAGPPLLIASLMFGGSATAVSAGSEAVNYNCEPSRLANRVIALHAVVKSILRLQDATREKINETVCIEKSSRKECLVSEGGVDDIKMTRGKGCNLDGAMKREAENSNDKADAAAGEKFAEPLNEGNSSENEDRTGTQAGNGKAKALVSSSGNFSKNAARHSSKVWTRASTNAIRSSSTLMTAGAISAVTVAIEAWEMALAVQRIRAGDPCDKAAALEEIRKELERERGKDGKGRFPETGQLAQEFERYASAVATTAS